MKRVLGIDPSIAATGFALPNGTTFTCKGKTKDGDRRLVQLYKDTLLAAQNSDLAVIEDLPANAMGAGLTGKAQGVVRLALYESGVPFVSVSPATLKVLATGSGRAKKPEMRKAFDHLRGSVSPKSVDDNQVDAWFLQLLGIWRLEGRLQVGAANVTDSWFKINWEAWGDLSVASSSENPE